MKNIGKAGVNCFIIASILSLQTATAAFAEWKEPVNGKWVFDDDMGTGRSMWRLIDGGWYYFDDSGYMTTGWRLVDKLWYFLNPVSDGLMGRMLTGWQWIDGKCYYLNPHGTGDYPQGAMYASGKTPDGWLVDAAGAWTDENGNACYIPEKGIQTGNRTSKKTASGPLRRSQGFGGGGGSPGKSHSSLKPPAVNEDLKQPDDQIKPDKPQEVQRLSYTVQYMDLEHKTILQVLTAEEQEGTCVTVDFPEIAGFTVFDGQKNHFLLTENGMKISIYYSAQRTASPSEAKNIGWELKFIEEGNPNHEIFKTQKGFTKENTELAADFPETILGTDRYYYHSLVPSPWRVIVSGPGIQKYDIEFRRGEEVPEESGPDMEAQEKLNQWMKIAGESDYELAGLEPSKNQLITSGRKESNERLIRLTAAVTDSEPHEIYLIAKGHVPNSLVIGQTFEDVIRLSELVLDQFSIKEEQYTVLRVGFSRRHDSAACIHKYIIADKAEPGCIYNGHETIYCNRCGQEETVIIPAKGHRDGDLDGICDICRGDANETIEAVFYHIGDVQVRNIGGRIYKFLCIDDDYEDAMDNSRRTALFLCENVIRSDIDSTLSSIKKMSFGADNNYKYSDIRKWLQKNAFDDRFADSAYIGITRSYAGTTDKGAYEQLDENSLVGYNCQFQLMEDKIFCLSAEEAFQYRDYLWKFSGSDTNNPQTQASAYSKGYYLRSPQNGTGIYVVDLTDGSVHPVDTKDTSIGIRPAMTIPQGS